MLPFSIRTTPLCQLVTALTAVAFASANVWADAPCRVFPRLGVRLMICRGGLGSGYSPAPDADWVMVFHGAPNETSRTPETLAPGTCTWAIGPAVSSKSSRVVFPFSGPLATDAYPIGYQARVCAGDARCVMSFCALDTGREWQAIDGFIRLSFW